MLLNPRVIISRGRVEIIGQFENTGHYLTVDQTTERIGVLKILNDANANVYDFLMHHPHKNLCTIYDYWLENDHIFVIEEYISGETLEELNKKKNLSEEEAVDILCQICDGLNVLHGSNPVIVHKDLKLSNVMIDSSGAVKIIDFNISRQYHAGAEHDTYTYATIPYASPEHFGFGQTNEKSDQYAIGQMMKRMGLEYGRFAKIIRKTTQVDPEKRYANVMELKQDIIGKSESLLPLPGFRTGILWKKIVAIVGYLLIFITAFSLETKNPEGPYVIWGNRLAVFFALLTEVDLLTKWTPLFRQVPLLDDSRVAIRIIAHAVLGVLIFVAWIFLEVAILQLFK